MIVICNEAENPIDPYLMEKTTGHHSISSESTHASSLVLNEEPSRIKVLCSFLGSILPRPQDGKLRYVGGETRIVCLPRDIKYEELMGKMRELYESATVLKYKQPDEDLDALVSVVNDDDVTNMMEEYEKLGSTDGSTMLRMFLFPYPEVDVGSSHYDGDERDHERRYVDALNHLNDGTEFRKLHLDSTVIGSFDDLHGVEQFFSPMSLEGGALHTQRNDMHMSQYSLHHLNTPHSGSGQHYPPPIGQRYNEMEAPWSPAFYSPRHHGHIDPRSMPEFPSSPTSSQYRMHFPDAPDRVSEEYSRPPLNHQGGYEQQPQYSDNVVWLPSGAISGEKLGFPGNILHGNNVVEGNSVSEHCRVCFRRNQPHYEHTSLVNGFHQVANTCADCFHKLHHGYTTEPNNDSSSLYNDNQNQWVPHHLNSRADEARSHATGPGKLNDHFILDGPGISLPHVRTNMTDMRHQSGNFIHQRAGSEMGNEVFHDRPMAGPPHVYIPPSEDRGVRYGNPPSAYGGDNVYPMSHGHPQAHPVYRNAQNTMHALSPYDGSNLAPQINGSVASGYIKHEGSPRYCIAADTPNIWVDPSPKVIGFEGKSVHDYSYGHALNLNPNTLAPEIHQQVPPELIQHAPDIVRSATLLDATMRLMLETELPREGLEVVDGKKLENSEMQFINQQKLGDKSEVVNLDTVDIKSLKLTNDGDDNDQSTPEVSNLTVSNLSFVPELMGSIKKAVIDAAEEVKAKVEETDDPHKSMSVAKENAASSSLEQTNTPGDCEADSDCENINNSKIEPTKAEAEAISKGLQTIKNDDLEEIRELGSGTYGAVFHGKWKGSDVAIKRIKASCFAGRPSERERLIADFWKEALILSSLHHPNVVSFYGIVRDGPDGSLATVTEFMVNGSLKQFLQKKDRTIDRRKRLIIAMDAAFGMEYLHGKNIVHFDLKCENLLVNMRDPQRPVCKIGDLGLSKVKQQTLVSGGVRGTLPWMAPELLSGKSRMVTEKIDVYSFGIVMWELLTGDEPYADRHCASIIGGIVNNTLRPQIPSWCDPEWKALMESCWGSEPGQRPSFSEISQKLRNMAAAMNVK